MKITEEKTTFCLRISKHKYKVVRRLAKNRRLSINKLCNLIIDCHIEETAVRKKGC